MSEQPDLSQAADIYRTLMDETRVRLATIDSIVTKLNENPKAEEAFMQAEAGFLQFRFICELIALSVLAAHQPYGLDEDLLESWHARLTLARLNDINPEGFPKPVHIMRNDGQIQFQLLPHGGLTSKRLQRFYDRSGRVLHRGVLAHLLDGKAREYNVASLSRWAAMIRAVLTHHAIMIPEKGGVLIVHLSAGAGGTAQVAIAMSDGPYIVEALTV